MVKLIKVDAVGHFDTQKKNSSRHAIYSIDFQPNGGRLATAGGDCTVKLWNTEAIFQQSQGLQAKEEESQLLMENNNENQNKIKDNNNDNTLLATLSTHTKSVNIVKWSKDGRFLASGSDDCYILIYRYTPESISTQSYGSNSSTLKNKETWSRCFTLQGHTMDILDLDWSPKG